MGWRVDGRNGERTKARGLDEACCSVGFYKNASLGRTKSGEVGIISEISGNSHGEISVFRKNLTGCTLGKLANIARVVP